MSHTEINFHLSEFLVTRSNVVSLNQQLVPLLNYIFTYITYLVCNCIYLHDLHIHMKMDNFMVGTFVSLKEMG